MRPREGSDVRGVNAVVVSGNVGSVQFGKTAMRGDDTCSFMLAVEKKRGEVTWTRVNVYGGLVQSCQTFLQKGSYVIVEGELMERMNKNKDNKILELRAKDIKFIHTKTRDEEGADHEPGDTDAGNRDEEVSGGV